MNVSMHEAPYECVECGGPEWSPTSTHGCRYCSGQGEIVPRGTRQKIIDRPNDVVETERDGVIEYSIDNTIFARVRKGPG